MEEKMSTNGVEVKLDNLIVSSSPHLRSNETVQKTMLDVIIALVPGAEIGRASCRERV